VIKLNKKEVKFGSFPNGETNAYINEMRTTFKDGKLIVDDSLAVIRKRLSEEG